jgi:hypothetical protein
MKPILLKSWIAQNQPVDDMRYKDAFNQQMRMFSDILSKIIFEDRDVAEVSTTVIGEHKSKSILLPVVKIITPDLRIIMRDNFHDWKVSVHLNKAINTDFTGLFDPSEKISSVYCQGFIDEWVYGPYINNHNKFTVGLNSDYDLYTFVYLVWLHSLGKKFP